MNVKAHHFSVYFIFACFSVSIFSCDQFTPRQKLAFKEMNDFAHEIKFLNNFDMEGSGGCFLDEQIKYFKMYFNILQLTELEESRETYFKLLCDFANHINKHNKILIYLPKQFCYFENISINLGFTDENYNESTSPYIWSISKTKNDTIIYRTYDQNNEKYPIIAEETFDEALDKIKQTNLDLYHKAIKAFQIRNEQKSAQDSVLKVK